MTIVPNRPGTNGPLYQPRGVGPPRLLAVFAHPDDEVFCAGGTIAEWARAGAEVMVVSATRGQAGQIRDVRVATRRTLGQVREAELRLACRRLGVSDVRCWDYRDGTLADADPEGLVRRIVEVMREFRPDAVVTFGPDGGYGHPDHMTISGATTAAWQRLGDPERRPAPQHRYDAEPEPGWPCRLFHASFPARDTLLMDRLAVWLTGRPERFAGSSDYVHALLLLVKEAGTMRYLSDHEQVQWYPVGSCVVEQGEASNELFVILSGTVEVWQQDASGNRRRLRVMGPGEFFGELGIAGHRERSADVVAAESLTCLVLSRGAPSKFSGRGAGARLVGPEPRALAGHEGAAGPVTQPPLDGRAVGTPGAKTREPGTREPETREPGTRVLETIDTDVSDVIAQKISALCAYRTQFPLEPDMFPMAVLAEIFGRECFVEVTRTGPDGDAVATDPDLPRPERRWAPAHLEPGNFMEVPT